MNDVSRARAYGCTSAYMSTRPSAEPASSASLRGGIPAAISIAATVNAITIAVPRSGWVNTSRHAAPTTSSSGLASSRRSCTHRGRLASSVATYSTSASFISSEGSNCSGPRPIQRCAPLTVTPTCGTCTASTSTNDVTSSGGVMRWAFATPSRASTCMATRPIAPYTTNLTRKLSP